MNKFIISKSENGGDVEIELYSDGAYGRMMSLVDNEVRMIESPLDSWSYIYFNRDRIFSLERITRLKPICIDIRHHFERSLGHCSEFGQQYLPERLTLDKFTGNNIDDYWTWVYHELTEEWNNV